MTRIILPLVLAFTFTFTTPASGALLATRFEDFTVDPGWTTINSGSNGNSFGYRLSANAGSALGEGGGRFTRSNFIRSYGDTNLGGVITFDDAFQASGRFDHTARSVPDFGRSMMLGHFSASGVAKIGINFTDNSTAGNLHWQTRIVFDDGSELDAAATAFLPNVDRTWTYTWDPNAGVHGAGELSLTFAGTTQNISLLAAARAKGITLDAFGFRGDAASPNRSNFFADMYVDDVTYSTAEVVPEPSAFWVWLSMLFVVVVGFRRRMIGHLRA